MPWSRFCSISGMTELTVRAFEPDILRSEKPVVLFFSTRWCMVSRSMAPILEELALEYGPRAKFIHADAAEHEDVMEQLGVRDVPAVLVLRRGKTVTSFHGGHTKAFLREKLTPVL